MNEQEFTKVLLDPQPTPGNPTIVVDRQWFEEAMEAQSAMLEVSVVYDHVTGGRLSKPYYEASVVIAEADAETSRTVMAETVDLREEVQEVLGEYRSAHGTIDRWARKIAATLDMHTVEQHPEGVALCSECRQSWPCRTTRVLGG